MSQGSVSPLNGSPCNRQADVCPESLGMSRTTSCQQKVHTVSGLQGEGHLVWLQDEGLGLLLRLRYLSQLTAARCVKGAKNPFNESGRMGVVAGPLRQQLLEISNAAKMPIWPGTAYSYRSVPGMLAGVCDDCTTHSANYPWNLLPSANVYRSSKIVQGKEHVFYVSILITVSNTVRLFIHLKKFKCIITIAPSLRMPMK